MVDFSLHDNALTVGGMKHYALGDMEHWSVADDTGGAWAAIMLHPKRGVRLPIVVHVPTAQRAEIEKRLAARLPKVEHEESFLDTLEKFLGF